MKLLEILGLCFITLELNIKNIEGLTQNQFINGVLRCGSNNKIFDEDQGKCVSKVGHPCVYTWFHELVSVAPLSIGSPISYMEHPDCVKNAFCNTDGICICKSKYYKTTNGTCQPLSKYMEPCNSDKKCHDPLKCIGGQCLCLDMSNSSSSLCVGLVGQDCINSLCTPHAICSIGTNKCVCQEGYFADMAQGQCLPKLEHWNNCTQDSQCFNNQQGKNFICVNGKCDCDPIGSVYENLTIPLNNLRWGWDVTTSIGRCVGKAGHPCIDGFCTINGFCTALSERTLKPICACLPSTLATKSGHCRYSHDQPCYSPDDCYDDLSCKNNVCSCKYADQIFDEQVHKCFSKVGGPCGLSSNLECTDAAKCWPIDSQGPGHCICKEGYIETIEGDCVASYGGECHAKSKCVSNLICRNNICRCDHFAWFNPNEMKCMGLVGASCGMPKDDECIVHSFCKQSHPKFQGHCQCHPGYFETSNYTCTKLPELFSTQDYYNFL